MKLSQLLVLALIAMLMFSSVTKMALAQDDNTPAEDAPDAEVEEEATEDYAPEQERDPNQISGVFARATFGSGSLLPGSIPAGEKVKTHIAVSNAAENPAYTVVFLMAHITHVADTNYYYQNFTGTRHNRAVAGGETATFKYDFTPDSMLEPNDYGLVVKLYFMNDNNQTYVTVAYNDTVTVTDPLGADPKTFMTFATLAGIIGGFAYFFSNKKKKVYKAAAKRSTIEMGTAAAFDPDYVSKDHLAFEEKRKSASPVAKRNSSPKK